MMRTCTAVVLGLYLVTAVSLLHYHYNNSYTTSIKAEELVGGENMAENENKTHGAKNRDLNSKLVKQKSVTSSEKPKDVSTSNGQKKSTVGAKTSTVGAKTSTVGPNEIRGHTESPIKAVVKDTPLKAVVKETPLKDVETDTPVKDVEKDTLVKDVEKNGFSVYRHTDLHPSNLTLIDIKHFNITINFDICNIQDIAMVITVTSAVQNRLARDVIRKTWGKPNIPGANTRLVFILGKPDNMTHQENLLDEAMLHQDIVQGDFHDTYRNLSYKTVFGKLWVARFCEQAEFMVKTDDDWILDLYETYTLTRRYLTHPKYKTDMFVLCPVRKNFPILRDKKNKWYVSYEELSKEEAKGTKYPNFCSGAFSIFTPGTAKRLAEKATSVKFLHLEDVWVTGYIVAALKIVHLDCMQYWTNQRTTFVVKKAVQTPEIYYRDYLVGPSDAEYEISYTVNQHAEWCFRMKCFNNIYFPNASLSAQQNIPDKTINKKLKLKV